MQSSIEPNPLAETDGRYVKVQNLGQGSFGFVQLGKAASGEMVAIKVISNRFPWPEEIAKIASVL